ncbi:MAG: DMT family transporter [Pyramidobacter sp.]|nr:DMT family transporter [Pyramidobacter sp.]
MNSKFHGILLALATGVLWAVSSPTTKLLGIEGVHMSTVVFFRTVGTSAILGALLYFWAPHELRATRRELIRLFFISLVVPTGLYLGFMLSVVYLSVSTALVIHYTAPTVTALCSRAITGEAPSRSDYIGAGLVVVGVACSVMRPDWTIDTSISVPGILYGVVAVAGLSGLTLLGRASVTKGGISGLGTFVYSNAFGIFWSGLYKTLTIGWSDIPSLTPYAWQLIVSATLLTCVLGYLLYYRALKTITAPMANLLTSTEIPAAVIMTSLAIHSMPSVPEMLGCAFIFSAIALESFGSRKAQ